MGGIAVTMPKSRAGSWASPHRRRDPRPGQGTKAGGEDRRMVVDAHQRFWNLERLRYAWIGPGQAIHRTVEPDELAPTSPPPGSTRPFSCRPRTRTRTPGISSRSRRGRRGSALLSAGCRSTGRPRPGAGSRPSAGSRSCAACATSSTTSPARLGRAGERGGRPRRARRMRPAVRRRGRVSQHLRHVPTLAARVPGLTMVIGHLAKPPIRARGWEPWASEPRAAAACPRVFAKVFGLNTAAGPAWRPDDLRPYVDWALEGFGPERLMFGSDWPVLELAGLGGRERAASSAARPSASTARFGPERPAPGAGRGPRVLALGADADRWGGGLVGIAATLSGQATRSARAASSPPYT